MDLSQSNHHALQLGAFDETITFSNPVQAVYTIIITQDGTGGRNIAWPTGVFWPDGAPDFTAGTAGQRMLVSLTYYGTTYLGAGTAWGTIP